MNGTGQEKLEKFEPLSIHAPGCFASVDSATEIEEANELAKASVIRVPQDLE